MRRLLALAGVMLLAISAGPHEEERHEGERDAPPQISLERQAHGFVDAIHDLVGRLLAADLGPELAVGLVQRIGRRAEALGRAVKATLADRQAAGELDMEALEPWGERVEVAGEAFGEAVEALMEARFTDGDADLDRLAHLVKQAAEKFSGTVLRLAEAAGGERGREGELAAAREELHGAVAHIERELAGLREQTDLSPEELARLADNLRERAEGLRQRLRRLEERTAQRRGGRRAMGMMDGLTEEQMEEVHAWLESAPEFLHEHIGQMVEMMHGPGPMMGMAPQGGGQRIIMRRFGEEGGHEGGAVWQGEGEWLELEGGEGQRMALGGNREAIVMRMMPEGGPMGLRMEMHGPEGMGMGMGEHEMRMGGMGMMGGGEHGMQRGRGRMGAGPRGWGQDGRQGGPGGPQVVPFPGGVVILFGGKGAWPGMAGPMGGHDMGLGMMGGEHEMHMGMMGGEYACVEMGDMGMGMGDMVMHTPEGEVFDPRIHLEDAGRANRHKGGRGGSARHGYPL